MDELRINQVIYIEFDDNLIISGIVSDCQRDRVMVLVDNNSIENAKKIKELDDGVVTVETTFGLKKMYSSVITGLNSNNCIIIENNEPVPVIQKRNQVRAVDNFEFIVEHNDKQYAAKCKNISAGGIAFNIISSIFNIGDDIKIILPEEIYSKKITCNAKIIKIENDFIVACYYDLNEYDESKIVKRIFKLLSSK